MQTRFSVPQLIIFAVVLGFIMILVQLGALTIAFDKLGLSSRTALFVLFASLFGSIVNIPLFQISADKSEYQPPPAIRQLLNHAHIEFHGKTIICINVGGCVIPLFISVYLLNIHTLSISQVILAIGIVTAASYAASRPVAGIGIGMPILIAPLISAITAIIINPEQSAALAYIGGVLGVLIGADILRLKDVRHMGTPIASIGGAGTFDGIFITGVVAVLLA